MELYLMQHGLAETGEDPDPPLSRAGVTQIQTSARAMKRLGLRFDLIACSPKKRARQTAALVAEAVNYPYSDLLESDLLKPLAPPGETLRLLERNPEDRAVLFTGHLPSLAEIAALLLGNGCRVRIHVENGGLLRIDRAPDQEPQGLLRYSLTAAQLGLLAG